MERDGSDTVKRLTACDVEALKKCLEENKGDYFKCKAQVEAFKTTCSLKKIQSANNSPNLNT